MVFDEAGVLIKNKAQADFIDYADRTFRKSGAGALTPKAMDLAALFAYAPLKFFLRQDDLEDTTALIRDRETRLGKFADFVVVQDIQAGTVSHLCRNYVTPRTYAMITSDKADTVAMETIMREQKVGRDAARRIFAKTILAASPTLGLTPALPKLRPHNSYHHEIHHPHASRGRTLSQLRLFGLAVASLAAAHLQSDRFQRGRDHRRSDRGRGRRGPCHPGRRLGAAIGAVAGLVTGVIVNHVIADNRDHREAERVDTARRAERAKIQQDYWEAERTEKSGAFGKAPQSQIAPLPTWAGISRG